MNWCSRFISSVLVLHMRISHGEEFLYPKIENLVLRSDPGILEVGLLPHRYLDGNIMTNAISGHFFFFEDMSCDAPFRLSLTPKIFGLFPKEPTLKVNLKLERVALDNNVVNSFFSNAVKSLRNAISPTLTCPIPKGVNFTLTNLVLKSNIEARSLLNEKAWNVSAVLWKNTGEETFAFWIEVELDDSEMSRQRKPSTVQRRERERKKQMHDSDN